MRSLLLICMACAALGSSSSSSSSGSWGNAYSPFTTSTDTVPTGWSLDLPRQALNWSSSQFNVSTFETYQVDGGVWTAKCTVQFEFLTNISNMDYTQTAVLLKA